MIKNYLTIAIRNLFKYKIYSIINILGLAAGITSTVLIIFYLQFEFSYDKFHNNSDNIYRVSVISSREGKVENDSPVFTPPFGPEAKNNFPEIKQYTRFSVSRTMYLYNSDRSWKVENISFADSTFFELFSFKLLKGNRSKVLTEPFSIVLTESIAKRIYGSENPIGKVIKIANKDYYKITGIAEDPPANSQIKFNALLSFATLYSLPGYYMGWNGGNQYYTYLELNQFTDAKQLQSKLPEFMWANINKRLAPYKIEYKAYLQPLNEIHLKYNEQTEAALANIYIFSAIAILIIMIACINFINLSIARATKRLKEIGVRKILGANRKNLFFQFITEYLLISFSVFFIVLTLIELFFPYYKELIGGNVGFVNPLNLYSILEVLGIIVFVGIIAGGYPAFYLSTLKPLNSLKGEGLYKKNKIRTKNILLAIQFSISVGLIICTLFISEQLNFIKNRDLGFNKENLLTIKLFNEDSQNKTNTFLNRLESIPGVLNASASSDIPYNNFTSNGYIPEGFKSPIMIHVVDADNNFLDTYGINILKGRNFTQGISSDSSGYIINEALASQLNWKDPIGKTIERNGKHKVIGVVKNFNYSSLYKNIEPLIITEKPYRNLFSFVTIRIGSSSIKNTLASIESEWKQINPAALFEFSFLENDIQQLYKSEYNFRKIFMVFAILAVFLALLGLFSLSSLSTEQKTKEIGIRKVLGDTSYGITIRILNEYLLLVLIANIIGSLFAYYFISKWLNNFAYHINQSVLVFLIAIVSTVFIGIVVVSFQAIKAANSNPIDAIRYE